MKKTDIFRCAKHKGYKRKPTWKCKDCKKEQELWDNIQYMREKTGIKGG